ncbi:hypothetical protein EVAR_27007_1 [Eumeta japonica]|uniref:Uncharacterized protein n=1 Tax=Eumeta variegata TaxID=151549 RepID=A0A4C1Z5U4_EUMVA|nr:hypothetical protein EVAR_27007_1 [Eumeta japonica]
MPSRDLNVSMWTPAAWNDTEWEMDMFYKPDVLIIVLYVAVLTTSLSANTLLIFVVIKFQYMRNGKEISKTRYAHRSAARALFVVDVNKPVSIVNNVFELDGYSYKTGTSPLF